MSLSTYKAKRIVCSMGMEVQRIHVCKNDCMLFCGDAHENLHEFLGCKFPRYKPRTDDAVDDSEKERDIPFKVVGTYQLFNS
jgi:hypothetical protein